MSDSKHPHPARSLRARSLGLGAIATVAALVAVPAGFAATRGTSGGAAAPVEAGQATVTIEIPEVSCAGCSLQVRKALISAGGVLKLGEGEPKNRLVIAYEPGSGRPAVYVEALHKAGFAKAHEVPPQPGS
ncbi:MAG: hypothetical protein HYV09_03045 [Deltaproteobacteria bacterium]|nr:hypothetical protein [Deltaproteobacteria bacterium]